jgi:hypothetical protein
MVARGGRSESGFGRLPGATVRRSLRRRNFHVSQVSQVKQALQAPQVPVDNNVR